MAVMTITHFLRQVVRHRAVLLTPGGVGGRRRGSIFIFILLVLFLAASVGSGVLLWVQFLSWLLTRLGWHKYLTFAVFFAVFLAALFGMLSCQGRQGNLSC